MNIFCKKINFYIRLCGFAIELQIQEELLISYNKCVPDCTFL